MWMWYFVLQVSLRSSQRLRLMVTVTSRSTVCLLFVSPPLWVAPKWGHRTQEPASLWTTRLMSTCFSAIPSISDPEETDLWDAAEELNWEHTVLKLIEKCVSRFSSCCGCFSNTHIILNKTKQKKLSRIEKKKFFVNFGKVLMSCDFFW